MNKPGLIIASILVLVEWQIHAQSVIISPNNSSAILDVNSTNKGLVVPKVTSPPTAIQTPAAGMVVYDQSNANLAYYNGAQWSNLTGTAGNQGLYSRFPNSKGFFSEAYFSNPSYVSHTWVVPAGVNQIWVEMWAGGDAGGTMLLTSGNTSIFSGGDAGDFASLIIHVSPGETLNLEIGKGGTSTFLSAGITKLITTAIPIRTYSVSQQRTGILFNESSVGSIDGLIQFVAGEDAHTSSTTYAQAGSTDYRRIITGGKGGDAHPNQKGGNGTTINYFMTDNSSGALISVVGRSGATPAAGGGASLGGGGSGGAGMMIIHW